jgi:hypothetical protein
MLPLRSGAHDYFVDSASGSDGNGCANAQQPGTPLKTLAAAMACVTAGDGDQVLLAEGTRYGEAMPWLSYKGGYSAQYPTVISSYDPSDPLNTTKYGRGDQRSARPVLVSGGGLVSGAPFSYLAIKGLDFDPGNLAGAQLLFRGDGTGGTGGGNYILIENNLFRYGGVSYTDGGDGTTAPRSHHFIIRNNSIYGAWAATDAAHTGCIYAEGNDSITVEDNVLYHCGWKIGVSRDVGPNSGGPTFYNHPLYIQANTSSTVRRNLFMDGAADAGIARGRNISWTENVSLRSPAGTGLGAGNHEDWLAQPLGSIVSASFNLSVAAINVNTANPSGYGYTVSNLSAGSSVDHNLLIYSQVEANDPAISFATTGDVFSTGQQTQMTFSNNVSFHWTAVGNSKRETGTLISNTYGSNIWDDNALGSNVSSRSAVFPNPYTESGLYAALTPAFASITDYTSLVNYTIAHPEAHVQRTMRALAFAGYGLQ